MKKQILTLSALISLALSSVPAVMAKPCEGHQSREHGGDAMRVLKQLDLSDKQKLDIKALMQQTREDNSVFNGEKKEMRMQMRSLMDMPAWDAQTARQLILTQMEHGKEIQLNRAEAKHKIFSLLTDEQKAELANKANKPKKEKSKHKREKREAKMQARMAKKLDLSDEQKLEFKAMHAATKALKDDFKPEMKAHQEQVKLLVQAEVFDATAWQALQDGFADKLIEHRVLVAQSKYNTLALLTQEQKETLNEMRGKLKDRMKHKRGK